MNQEYDKYVKIVYQTEPIGKEKIILYLTTFDTEAFERDKKLRDIPKEKIVMKIDIDSDLYVASPIEHIEQIINEKVKQFYEKEILDLKKSLEYARREYRGSTKNVTNSENIYCDIIEGNVINCDNVHCKEIKGNTINCEIYRE